MRKQGVERPELPSADAGTHIPRSPGISTPLEFTAEKLCAVAERFEARDLLASWNAVAAFDMVTGAGHRTATDFTAEVLRHAASELSRLQAEVASLRAALGEPTGAEPIGCPCPGACSATALQATSDRLQSERDELEGVINRAYWLVERDDTISAASAEQLLDILCRALTPSNPQDGSGGGG